jgi:hypothetical protein
MKKTGAFLVALLFGLCALTACSSSGGLPDGTYKPVAVTSAPTGRVELADNSPMFAAFGSYSINIKGDTFTFKMSGTSVSMKYSYKEGAVTFKALDTPLMSVSYDIEYRDGSLIWSLGGGMTLELKRT